MDKLQQLKAFFSFDPTVDQHEAFNGLYEFTTSSFQGQLLVLKGYAGTGKTSLMAAYINWLSAIEKNFVLLAPTGRAAKVLSSYSSFPASTIHKGIYYQGGDEGGIRFSLQQNKMKGAVFIVDEASMIGNGGALGGSFSSKERTLLDDLIQFVYGGKACKLILIGDEAQLPPVGNNDSPALNVEYLQSRYPLNVQLFSLTEVTRQALDSGILYNANQVRSKQHTNDYLPCFDPSFEDVFRVGGYDVEELLSTAYSRDGIANATVICRSNKQANNFNKYIRYQVLAQEDELSSGDQLMVVRNNYFWLAENGLEGFLANGEVFELMGIKNFEERYGFRFANVTLGFHNGTSGKYEEFEAKVLIDVLYSESAALAKEEGAQFFEDMQKEYASVGDKRKRMKEIRKDPYWNALQIKFSYAITCHKSQGGQWKNVFVDQGYVTEEMIDEGYMRWLYTAVTRAQDNLYLCNFHERFFEGKEI